MPMTETQETGRGQLELLRIWYSIGIFMLVLVAVASLLPAPDVGVGDKLSHLVTYLVLAGWFSLLAVNWRQLVLTVIGLLAYGGLIELLQGLTSYRYPEWADLLANGIGIAVGILFYFSPLSGLLRMVDGLLMRSIRRRGL